MPMGAEYDKLINSKNADMKNIGGRYGGVHHRRAVPAALRQGHAVGASRHRRHRDGLAGQRDQPVLGLAASACGCSTAWCATTTKADRSDGRSAVLPPDRVDVWKTRCPAWSSAVCNAAGGQWCRPDRRSAATHSMRISGPIATSPFLPMGSIPSHTSSTSRFCSPPRSGNPNGASIRFFVDGAEAAELEGYERVVFLFDGHDDAQVGASPRTMEGREGS